MTGARWILWGRGLLVLALFAAGWRVWPRFEAARGFHADPGLPSLEEASRRAPDDSSYHFRLGVIRRDLPEAIDLEAARVHLEKAVELNPYSWRFRRELGLLHELAGRTAEAEASYAEAVRLNPGSADYRWRMANFQTRAGSLEKAVPHFRLALDADPRLRPGALRLLLGSGASLEVIEAAWPESLEAREDLLRLLCQLDDGERPADFASFQSRSRPGYDSVEAICASLQ